MLIDTCLGMTVAYLGLSLGTQFFSKQKLNAGDLEVRDMSIKPLGKIHN